MASNKEGDNKTIVTWYIEDEETPFRGSLTAEGPEGVALSDFKKIIPPRYHRHKFYFKHKDEEFGIVKLEILDENTVLPLFDGQIVSYLVATEGSMISESTMSGIERGPGVGQTRPPSFHSNRNNMPQHMDHHNPNHGHHVHDDTEDTESAITSVSQQAANMRSRRPRMAANGPGGQARHHHLPPLPGPGIQPPGSRLDTETSSSMRSSEYESSVFDEDVQSEASSRVSTDTDHTSVSRQNQMMRHRQKRKSQRKVPAHLNRAVSMSSVTDSTMSLNIMTVILNMDTVNFLGISIVGQSNKDGQGDCGIYVGSIMKGGAVALDGRIDPGDMILQVNETSFDNMTNDDAVRVLKEVVQNPGPIRLVVAKVWPDGGQSSTKGYLTLPRSDPVRPIDPGAWVAHTAAVRDIYGTIAPPSVLEEDHLVTSRDPLLGDFPGRAPSLTTLSATSIISSQPDTEKYLSIHQPPRNNHRVDGGAPLQLPLEHLQTLTKDSGMLLITRKMRQSDSGLEIKDRTWLKLKISNAFLGSDLVEWLHTKVEGFQDRKEARKYAVGMLQQGSIKDTVNKSTFSEQCYYTFPPEAKIDKGMGQLNLNESIDSNPGMQHPSAPLPMASGGSGGSSGHGIWGANMPSQQPLEPVWTGGLNSTYGGGQIYNPAAPPPSANYYGFDTRGSGGSGSGSHRSNNRLILAGSGSGSDSDRASNVMGSDRSSLLRNPGLRSGPIGRPQAVFQGQ